MTNTAVTPSSARSGTHLSGATGLDDGAKLAGRALLSLIFILSGFSKLTAYGPSVSYMESAGLPGVLMPLVILTELGGGLLFLVGYQTRLVAIALAGFTLLSALFFHRNFADMNQMIHFLKNVAIAGGFLVVFAAGAGRWSLDSLRA